MIDLDAPPGDTGLEIPDEPGMDSAGMNAADRAASRAAVAAFHEKRRADLQGHMVADINRVIGNYSYESRGLKLPVFDATVQQKAVVAMLETALSWCHRADLDFEKILEWAKRRQKLRQAGKKAD